MESKNRLYKTYHIRSFWYNGFTANIHDRNIIYQLRDSYNPAIYRSRTGHDSKLCNAKKASHCKRVSGKLAAVALALYTLIPGNITKQYSSITITGYGMLLGGIVLAVLSQAWKVQLSSDFRFIAAFAGIVIFGTVLTFTLYLKGITMVGPVTASMLASVEPVSAAAFMIVWLKVPFHYMDLIGFSCILITIFLLTKKERSIE